MTGLDTILAVATGLLGGVNIFQLIFFRTTRDKHRAEASSASTSAAKDKEDLRQNQYDYLLEKLTAYQKMYSELSDKIMEDSRKKTEEIEKIAAKHKAEIEEAAKRHKEQIARMWEDIARLKARIKYLQGLTCMRADCPNRIPDEEAAPDIILQTDGDNKKNKDDDTRS
ncbi:MAG: hypothetical protein LUC18_00035 [Porphyromonadaceae bacterium]|nr:hypothetical protein [Porphyromonadaceae bacterium]